MTLTTQEMIDQPPQADRPAADPGRSHQHDTIAWIRFAALIVAFALQSYHIRGSLYGDEWHAMDAVDHPNFWGNLLSPSMSHPPLFFLLARCAHSIVGQPWAIRLPSLLAGMASVCIFPYTARRILGPRSAGTASWVVATAPFLIEFGGEGRPYALVILFSLLYIDALWWFLHEESIASLAALLSVTLIGVSTHHFFALLVAAGAVVYLVVRKRLTRYATLYLLAIAACLMVILPIAWPHAMHVAQQTRTWSDALQQFNLANFLARLPIALSFGFSTFAMSRLDVSRNIELQVIRDNAAIVVVAGGWLAGCGLAAARGWLARIGSWRLLVALVILPTCLAVLASSMGLFLVREKYLAIVYPAWLLITVSAIAYLSQMAWGRLAVACYWIAVGLSLVHFLFWPNLYSRRSDWNGLCQRIEAIWQPGDMVIYYHLPGNQRRLQIRVPAERRYSLRELLRSEGSLDAIAERLDQQGARIILIDEEAMRNGVDPQAALLRELQLRRHREEISFGRNLRLVILAEPSPRNEQQP
ncbi:MAG: glycosyltransferase family 39 protein [Pirellulales bacterium]